MDLNQITLPVLDFDRSVDFYRALGLKLIVSSRGEYARLELPSGASTLSLHLSSEAPAHGPTFYFETEHVDRRYEELRAAGIEFDSPPRDEPWRWREARFRDPSGNRLCLYHAGPDRRFPPWRLEDDSGR